MISEAAVLKLRTGPLGISFLPEMPHRILTRSVSFEVVAFRSISTRSVSEETPSTRWDVSPSLTLRVRILRAFRTTEEGNSGNAQLQRVSARDFDWSAQPVPSLTLRVRMHIKFATSGSSCATSKE